MLNIDEAVGVGTAGQLADDSGLLAQFFELAGVTAFGFVILAVVSAALGYVISGIIWRVMVGRRRARRLQQMESRLDQRLGTSEG